MEIEEFIKNKKLIELDEALGDAKDSGVTLEEAIQEVNEIYEVEMEKKE